jgi:hypothetical protein
MSKNTKDLGFLDIVLNADSETIKQAYEARCKIDTLLIERDEAYKKIYELEVQIDEIVGESGIFPFPEPPVPVAGFAPKKGVKAKKIVNRTKTVLPNEMLEEDEDDTEEEYDEDQDLDLNSEDSDEEESESEKSDS